MNAADDAKSTFVQFTDEKVIKQWRERESRRGRAIVGGDWIKGLSIYIRKLHRRKHTVHCIRRQSTSADHRRLLYLTAVHVENIIINEAALETAAEEEEY